MAKGTKTGGRIAGTLNKATRDIKEAAQIHGPKAIEILSSLMLSAESETARIAAAKEILDRGYGRSPQPLHHGDNEGGKLQPVLNILATKQRTEPASAPKAGTRVLNGSH